MAIKKITLNELRNLVKQVIKENRDEYGDEIDYSKSYRKDNFKINHPQDDSGEYPEDFDDNFEDESMEIAKERAEIEEKRRHLFYEIRDIFSEIDLNDYGFSDDGSINNYIVEEIVDSPYYWISMQILTKYGEILSLEEIQTILKKNLNSKDYGRLNISVPKNVRPISSGKYSGYMIICNIDYYASANI